MKKGKKDILVEDFYKEIRLASTKALVIFQALGYNSSANDENWVKRNSERGINDLITGLVQDCINQINDGQEESNMSTGMIYVSVWVDRSREVELSIKFDLL